MGARHDYGLNRKLPETVLADLAGPRPESSAAVVPAARLARFALVSLLGRRRVAACGRSRFSG